MKQELLDILAKRYYLVKQGNSTANIDYYNAILLTNFGVVVNHPDELTYETVKSFKLLSENVPASFYSNPQNIKYYTATELLVEQIASYFLAYGQDNSHVELFEKDLPDYFKEDRTTIRMYKLITEEEALPILVDIASSYSQYTRPFSQDEFNEVINLVKENFFNVNMGMSCRDNIMELIYVKDIREKVLPLANHLDYKDAVKFSIKHLGQFNVKKYYWRISDTFNEIKATVVEFFKTILPLIHSCELSKKQTKYFNKICKMSRSDIRAEHRNVMMGIKEKLNNSQAVEVATLLSNHGSLLERNIQWILSRAKPEDIPTIIDMIKDKNPILLYQLLSGMVSEKEGPRTFRYIINGLVSRYTETEEEAAARKSILSPLTKITLSNLLVNKIKDAYSRKNIGKIYIAPEFYKTALPINTSVSGKGLDILPTGSRTSLASSKVRTFVYWKGVCDIDASLLVVKNDDSVDRIYFGNFVSRLAGNAGGCYRDAIWFSGDCTSRSGSEYYDLDLEALKKLGVKYIVQGFWGFGSNLNVGEIQCGYQVKEDFNNKAWDPKNIAMQMHIKGDKNECQAFAFDLTTDEVITLNLLVNNSCRVIAAGAFKNIVKYVSPDFMILSMGNVLEYMGTKVDNIEEADIVFSNSYVGDKETIKAFNTEKLVELLNS